MLLRVITIILISIPFVSIGMAYLLPASTEVSRSITIASPPEPVYEVLVDLRQWKQWSPWAEKDPNIELRFDGPEKGVGAQMHWQSENPKVGSGSQKIVSAMENERVELSLAFSGQNPASAFFELEPVSETETVLLWGFYTEHGRNPVNRYMGLLFDSWLGPDYEHGLKNIKMLVENNRETAKHSVEMEDHEN